MNVPAESTITVTCNSVDSAKNFFVNVLDGPNYNNYYGDMGDGRTCLNGLCDTQNTGTFSWSGMTPNSDPIPYCIVIDKQDPNVCLDLTCSIEIV